MKCMQVLVTTILLSGIPAFCFASSCTCDDWMGKGGYCVDYIKIKIPEFPVPQDKDDMEELKNTDVTNVLEGDVAIFTISNYWHVAYVEKVHRDRHGKATAVDVSEKNFGDELSFTEFKSKWKSKSHAEWSRARCCGITDNYDQVSVRKNVAIGSVKQVWSPDNIVTESVAGQRVKVIAGKAREAINRFIEFTGREL